MSFNSTVDITSSGPVPILQAIMNVPSYWTSHHTLSDAKIWVFEWLVQFVMSWVGFTIFMWWDYKNYKAGTLEAVKLPTRHPVDVAPLRNPTPENLVLCRIRFSEFWYAQAFMVPLVLFNQLVVWPLVSLLFIWPIWHQRYDPTYEWGALQSFLLFLPLLFVSDCMWYASHRSLHFPWAWKYLHRFHHVAPQCALSATYVHPVEYTLFTTAMQLPYAIIGYPWYFHLIPLGWGMLTGSGGHSGYTGPFANADMHNAHHLYHNVNFGLVLAFDRFFGTFWAPGDKPPVRSNLLEEVEQEFHDVHGNLESVKLDPLLANLKKTK